MTDDSKSATAANRRTITDAFEAVHSGVRRHRGRVRAPEMVWRIEGHSMASRQYDSKRPLRR